MSAPLAFVWSPRLSVGDATIDEQHRQIFDQANRLLGDIVDGTSRAEAARKTFAFLDRYILDHFSYEERFMEENGYPDLDRHREIHARFAARYDELKKKTVDSGFSDMRVTELESLVGNWLTTHILEEDMRYVFFIRDRRDPSGAGQTP